MSEHQEEKQQVVSGQTSGGSTGPVSGVGGMSATERIAYIRELQKASPLNKISDSVKKLTAEAFGLSRNIFDQAAQAYKAMQTKYVSLQQKDKRFGLNQHISGLTENVRGQERLIHEVAPEANVDLPDGRSQEKKRGLYVESDWTPRSKGQVE
jgi:hypothetical protein